MTFRLSFRVGGVLSDEKHLIAFLERLTALSAFKLASVDQFMLRLSLVHIRNTAGEGQIASGALQDQISQLADPTQTKFSAEGVEAFTNYFAQFIKEHYLNPAQQPEHTNHTPFSPELVASLERAWQLRGTGNQHGGRLMAAQKKIREVQQKGKQVIDETMDLTAVPSKGILRVVGGDLGDACYTSQHEPLAKGEFPGITSLTLVTNRKKNQERMVGSVLCVESTTKDGERILYLRANNPRENILQRIDVSSYNDQLLDYAEDVAKKRGIRYIGLVRDPATQASSNRPAISGNYAERFGDAPAVMLEDSPDTNFNITYKCWDPSSGHPVVIVRTVKE